MPIAVQVGAKTESAFNTPVVVDRFFEFENEGVTGAFNRTESVALHSGQRGQPAGRYAPWYGGAAGPWVFQPQTKDFAMWLVHMLGAVATTGPTDSAYTHTGTVATLTGDSFTWQVNRPFHPSGTDQAFTYSGGKIASWTLSMDAEGLLTATFNLDFASETTATALASASYSAASEPFYWTKGLISLGGSAVDLKSFSVTCNNNLQVDRRYLRNSSIKSEQVEGGYREITFECVADFSSLTQYNRFASTTASGAEAAIVATFTGPTLIGATTYPDVVITLPAARFDGSPPSVGSLEPLTQTLTGKALVHSSSGHISVVVHNAQTTP